MFAGNFLMKISLVHDVIVVLEFRHVPSKSEKKNKNCQVTTFSFKLTTRGNTEPVHIV